MSHSNIERYDHFGRSFSLHGSFLSVSARVRSEEGPSAAVIHTYTLEGAQWTEDTTLYASQGGRIGYGKNSVSMDSEYIIVGAETHEEGAGTGYIYKRPGSFWHLYVF